MEGAGQSVVRPVSAAGIGKEAHVRLGFTVGVDARWKRVRQIPQSYRIEDLLHGRGLIRPADV